VKIRYVGTESFNRHLAIINVTVWKDARLIGKRDVAERGKQTEAFSARNRDRNGAFLRSLVRKTPASHAKKKREGKKGGGVRKKEGEIRKSRYLERCQEEQLASADKLVGD